MVRILGFHCHGPGSIPGWETEILQVFGVAKKQNKTKPKRISRTSLVAQWFDPWSGKVPHAAEQLSLCATTTEPVI